MNKTLTTVIISCAMNHAFATSEPMAIALTLDDSRIATHDFLGFGAEWDSYSYDENQVDDQDFALIEKRMTWMEVPLVRTMMIAKWCYLGDGKYDWNTGDMQQLYRHLDLCQKLGITVYLTEWGCNDSWLNIPDVEKISDKKYAEIIGTYLDYLIGEKKYTCIKGFILSNEPNLSGYGWDAWKEGIENLAAELKLRRLDKKLVIIGSDQSNGDDWHTMAVDQLQDYFGIYDNHKYANDEMVRPGELYDYFKELKNYALEHDPKAKDKPFIVGEAGLNNFAKHPYGNDRIDSVYYGIFMADYAVQAVNAGSDAVFTWMLDDNSHLNFYWGLWTDKKTGMELRPYFFVWSLLTKYFPPHSTVYDLGKVSADIRVLAASISAGGEKKEWSFCVVNRGDQPVEITLYIPGETTRNMKRYIYGGGERKVDEDGFPLPDGESEFNLSDGITLTCEGQSVKILTSLM